MSDDKVDKKQMHFGVFNDTDEYLMAVDALEKFKCSKWGRANAGFRTLFLSACDKYNNGEIQL